MTNLQENKEITSNQIDYNYDYFTANLIPFGSLDIRTAIVAALEVGEDGDWAAEQVREIADSCNMKLEDCDPVYCVYYAILQEARNEIYNLINFDFCNNGADIYTAGNFMATSYDWSDEAPETIKQTLIDNEISFEELSIKLQWFLNEINATY